MRGGGGEDETVDIDSPLKGLGYRSLNLDLSISEFRTLVGRAMGIKRSQRSLSPDSRVNAKCSQARLERSNQLCLT
jgi:hypothetical protein